MAKPKKRQAKAKQRRLTSREVAAILARNGFVLVGTRGSHEKWRNSLTKCQVIVPAHQGKQLPIGTLKSIMKGSGIAASEWK